MASEVKPLFGGAIDVGRRVIVRDPLGISRLEGAGILRVVEFLAGRPWRVHVDLGPHRMLHVPPDWVHPDPAAAPNVVPFARPGPAIEGWDAQLFPDAPPPTDGAA